MSDDCVKTRLGKLTTNNNLSRYRLRLNASSGAKGRVRLPKLTERVHIGDDPLGIT